LITFTPKTVAAANVAPSPGSSQSPSVCATGAPPNYTCFAGLPVEVDPSEILYGGVYGATSANPSIATATACPTAEPDGTMTCLSATGLLVNPNSVGTTTFTVVDSEGHASLLPVSVADTTISISLQGLSTAQSVCINYAAPKGVSGTFGTTTPVTSPASNPTVVLANAPAPVNVAYTMFRAVVNPSGGTSTCENGLAQSTLSGFKLIAGQTNTVDIIVSPTTQ
jgi:hypothetical protein